MPVMKYIKEYLPIVVVATCLVKVLMAPEPSFANSALLLIALGFFALTTYINSKSEDRFEVIMECVEHLESRLNELHAQMEAFKPIQAQVAKSAEDIQKVISTTNLSQSLYQRVRKRETPSS